MYAQAPQQGWASPVGPSPGGMAFAPGAPSPSLDPYAQQQQQQQFDQQQNAQQQQAFQPQVQQQQQAYPQQQQQQLQISQPAFDPGYLQPGPSGTFYPQAGQILDPNAGFAGLLPAGSQAIGGRKKKARSSLTLEMFLFFGGWYGWFFWAFNVLVFVHKGAELLYPNGSYSSFAMEWSFAWLYIVVDRPRLSFLMKGNRTEQWPELAIGIVLSMPLLALHIFYINWQVYVFKVDVFINAIALALMGMQFIIAVLMLSGILLKGRFRPRDPNAPAGPKPIAVPGGQVPVNKEKWQ